mmetsp:Transcript_28005/g.32295  ORF Transcript_28005/g.32295 Transcript_28005/m.32295 type:complete len:111 (-) Transcript_28005:334-666(-)
MDNNFNDGIISSANDCNISRENSTIRENIVRRNRTKHVSFADVDIHEHYYIIGDSPSCSEGPPCTLSWTYLKLMSMTVNEFEKIRPPIHSRDDFKMCRAERIGLLLQSGY